MTRIFHNIHVSDFSQAMNFINNMEQEKIDKRVTDHHKQTNIDPVFVKHLAVKNPYWRSIL